MNSLSVPVLHCQITPSGSQRFIQTSSSLDINGFCFDVKFIVPDDSGTSAGTYSGGWDFLKDIFVNIALRLGGTTAGTQVALISNVPLYDILMYSDYIAGVSMSSTKFVVGETARISGYVDAGFFSMGSRDALDVSISMGSVLQDITAVDLSVNAVYRRAQSACLITYNTAKPTGADSPFTNVLQLFYCGDSNNINDNAVIRDETGTKTVNIEDAIAYTNAVGHFEFFERFGLIYEDTYGLSQDISCRVPVISGDDVPTILVKRFEFVDGLLNSNMEVTTAERNALLSKIQESDPVKYNYLVQLGIA